MDTTLHRDISGHEHHPPLTGWLLSPMITALAMSLSSVSVIANALRLRGARIRQG